MGWSWHHPALRRGRSRARIPKRRPPSTTRGERVRRRSPGPRRSSPPNSVLAATETVTFSFQTPSPSRPSNVRLRRRRPRRAGRQMSISQQDPLRARASVAFLPSCRDKPLCPISAGDLHWPIPHPTFSLSLFRAHQRDPEKKGRLPISSATRITKRDPICDRAVASERAEGSAHTLYWSVPAGTEEEQKDIHGVGTTSSSSARARDTREDKTETRLRASGLGSEREIRETNTVLLW